MEDIIQELNDVMRRLKEAYIYNRLPEKLMLNRVDEDVARTCSVEFSEVVDEYSRNLKYFVDIFDESLHQSFLEKFVGHLEYTSDTTSTKIDDIAQHLSNHLAKFESNDE